MNNVILMKTTSTGKQVEIVVERYMDSARATAYVDGKLTSRFERVIEVEKYFQPEQLRRVPSGITHIVGKIALTASEAAVVEQALAVAQTAIDQEPQVMATKLRAERRDLVAAIGGWVEEEQDASNRAWERGDEAGAFVGGKVEQARQGAAAARHRLAQFDEAHPEVKAEIEREQDEAVEKHLWD